MSKVVAATDVSILDEQADRGRAGCRSEIENGVILMSEKTDDKDSSVITLQMKLDGAGSHINLKIFGGIAASGGLGDAMLNWAVHSPPLSAGFLSGITALVVWLIFRPSATKKDATPDKAAPPADAVAVKRAPGPKTAVKPQR